MIHAPWESSAGEFLMASIGNCGGEGGNGVSQGGLCLALADHALNQGAAEQSPFAAELTRIHLKGTLLGHKSASAGGFSLHTCRPGPGNSLAGGFLVIQNQTTEAQESLLRVAGEPQAAHALLS